MAVKRYIPKKTSMNGIYDVHLDSWQEFSAVVHQKALRRSTFLYRGHMTSEWTLVPSLYRILEKKKNIQSIVKLQLKQYKMAARGRCSLGERDHEEKWWALGQHMGLATPLLDWTESPFVALFFAFAENEDLYECTSYVEYRVVFMLDRSVINNRCHELKKDGWGESQLIKFVEPFSHENQRIVGQSGLFTVSPDEWAFDSLSLEDWVNEAFDGVDGKPALIKVYIPNTRTARRDCLRSLNRMNINYLSLFPDLEGSGKHCNLKREISSY
jgi:hypothetical protein